MTTKNDIHEINLPILNALKDIGSEKYNEYKEKFLIAEAKNRGFKNGVTILRGDWYSGFSAPKVTIEKEEEQHPTSGFEFRNDTLFLGGYTIFYKGNWAQILPQEKTVVPMEKALKIIAKKMKVSPENIEIQS